MMGLLTSAILPDMLVAKPWWMRGVESNEGEFLPPDEAFRVNSSIDGDLLRIRYVIAEGYYLYREKMLVQAESPDLTLSPPSFPSGTMKNDPYLGTQEIFTQQVEATVAYRRHDGGAHPLQIKLTYQGCATAGLCYPPIVKVLFPGNAPEAAQPGPRAPRAGEAYGIIGGALAFLAAGLLLRKGRRLDIPA